MSKAWNIGFFTFGGLQLWCDRLVYNGWRIQENHWSKRCRLLDPYNIRRARGSYAECLASLENVKKIWELKEPKGHLIIMLHGLGSSCNVFNSMKTYFHKQGQNSVALSYPSTRLSFKSHIENLEIIMNKLEGIESVSFVTFGLGGLLIRELMAKESKWQQTIRVKRLVQISPPNNGSVLADKLSKKGLFKAFLGDCLNSLKSESVKKIPEPKCEFGIIAGGSNDEKGICPFFFKGDNDIITKVEETRIAGFSDFMVVNAIHYFLPRSSQVISATANFLDSGRFSKGKKIKKEVKFI